MYAMLDQQIESVSGAALATRSLLIQQASSGDFESETVSLLNPSTGYFELVDRWRDGVHFADVYQDTEYDDVTMEIFSVTLRTEEWTEWNEWRDSGFSVA